MSDLSKLLSKSYIKHRVAARLLERVVFGEYKNDKIIDLAAGVLHYKFLLET
jgi:hypothetical protein